MKLNLKQFTRDELSLFLQTLMNLCDGAAQAGFMDHFYMQCGTRDSLMWRLCAHSWLGPEMDICMVGASVCKQSTGRAISAGRDLLDPEGVSQYLFRSSVRSSESELFPGPGNQKSCFMFRVATLMWLHEGNQNFLNTDVDALVEYARNNSSAIHQVMLHWKFQKRPDIVLTWESEVQ